MQVVDYDNDVISVLETSNSALKYVQELNRKIFNSAFKSKPKMDLVEWADTYRMLPDNSAEHGKWHTSRVPPAREPMLAISDPETQEVSIMSCIQLLKTELMINTALFYIHQEPSPIMYVAPKSDIGKAWSKERFQKSVNATPEVRDLMSHNRRDQGNTILQKQFPGGQISIVSARNPDDLAMRACRIMLFDECDKYPANVGSDGAGGGEGDAIAVAWGRATTYGKKAKKIVACSPTVENRSRIEAEFKNGSQESFHQECPNCGKSKCLEWDDVHIPVDEETGEMLPDDAHILCSGCGHAWSEGERIESIDKGYYVAKFPERKHHRSFRVTSLSHPWTPVPVLAREFVDAQGRPEMLKAFYNTRMARTWREKGDQPDWQRLYETRDTYEIGVVPKGGLRLYMGMDIQKNGAYYEVVSYGRKRRSWSIEAGFLEGNINDDDFREKIKSHWNRSWKNYRGIEMQPEIINVDTGYEAHAVYSLIRESGNDRVRAVKGDKEGRMRQPVGVPTVVDINYSGQRIARGLMLYHVGSGMIKRETYSWLGLTKPTDEKIAAGGKWPTGFCHFPQYEEEFFKSLTGEQCILQVNKQGFEVYIWEKIRERNDFLDCRVYARAGSIMDQLDRFEDKEWLILEEKYDGPKIDSETKSTDTVAKPPARRKAEFWDR